MKIIRMLFDNVVVGNTPYHAALCNFPAGPFRRAGLHNHDFFEWMVPLGGIGLHLVNGSKITLTAGHLILVRPEDVHLVDAEEGHSFEFINLAFRAELWHDYVRATGVEQYAEQIIASDLPPSWDISPRRIQVVAAAASNMVRSYHANPSRLEFGRFWNTVMECIVDQSGTGPAAGLTKPWLRDLLEWAQTVDIAELNVDTLTEKSSVSFAHLSRSLKASTGMTPTQYINSLRVNRAAYKLATSDQQIIDIAFDCGFENLSYFYRKFQEAYRQTPMQYRLKALTPISPPQ